MRILFDNIEDFYRANRRRETSVEVDYGCHWMAMRTWPRYRLSFIVDTGEVYAIREQLNGAVILIATGLPRGEAGRVLVDELLYGWEEKCGDRFSLGWAFEALFPYTPEVLDEHEAV